jgi:hypothetical protein
VPCIVALVFTFVVQKMTPFYKSLCAKCPKQFSLDEGLVADMQAQNEETLKQIDVTQEEAEKDSGG